MNKWTKDKILKQAKVGNYYTFSDDNDTRVIIHILDDSIKGYHFKCKEERTFYFDDVDKYIYANKLRIFRDYECTQEILPESIKTKKLVKFHQYLDEDGLVARHFFNEEFKRFWDGKMRDRPALSYKKYHTKTSNYIEVEIEVEE